MEQLIKISEVIKIVEFKKTKIYKMINNGTFPPGFSDGIYRRWSKNEIQAFRVLYWGLNEKIPKINNLNEIQKFVEKYKSEKKC